VAGSGSTDGAVDRAHPASGNDALGTKAAQRRAAQRHSRAKTGQKIQFSRSVNRIEATSETMHDRMMQPGEQP
jgi:hypothetical protein